MNQPQPDLYTRNGFAGPATGMVRGTYSPEFTRVEGDYRPQRFETWHAEPAVGPRALPSTILDGGRVRLDLWHREVDTPFAVRDVHHDQLLYVLEGSARLETDFGVLDIEPLDMVLLPKAVTFRLTDVRSLRLIILVNAEPLRIEPENAAVLNPFLHVGTPRPYEDPLGRPGEHEVLIRHGRACTSYFYDYDPLAIVTTVGAPVVQRFNLANVSPLGVKGGGAPPARLLSDPATETMIYYLGSRESGQPPVHHNADYDEIGIYCCGPASFGAMTTPGTLVWVPKGIIHRGPEENVPEGYVAWLFETRANLELTEAGRGIAELTETTMFGVHPSVHAEAAAGR